MNSGNENEASASGRRRGPAGLGQKAAVALEQSLGSGKGVSPVEEESFLQDWLAREGRLISEESWLLHHLIANQTAEHEVRYREADNRAVKKTWPGTFGMVPVQIQGKWEPRPATPRGYLQRMALQNELFADKIDLEGGMLSTGPSLIIGQPAGGFSLVISQPWLDAVDPHVPHPSEHELLPYLRNRGFEPLYGSFFGWRNESARIVVLDAKPDNFILTSAGILPIDLLIAELPMAA